MQQQQHHDADTNQNAGKLTPIDRAAIACAVAAGMYCLVRGIWWLLLWGIGQ